MGAGLVRYAGRVFAGGVLTALTLTGGLGRDARLSIWMAPRGLNLWPARRGLALAHGRFPGRKGAPWGLQPPKLSKKAGVPQKPASEICTFRKCQDVRAPNEFQE